MIRKINRILTELHKNCSDGTPAAVKPYNLKIAKKGEMVMTPLGDKSEMNCALFLNRAQVKCFPAYETP